MTVHIFQHVPFEDIGCMASYLTSRGANLRYTRFYERDAQLPLPSPNDPLIIMGGPMSVNDEAVHPWLREEKQLIRARLEHGAPVLGICLGAQLMASALGARVYPNATREIGWFPVRRCPSTAADTFFFPDETTVFHWHGETFDLPENARWLASSTACAHQAFQIGRRAIGLQFHLETTPESAAALIGACSDELTGGPFVQTEAALRATPASTYQAANRLMNELLAYLL